MPPKLDLIGQKFVRLTVISEASNSKSGRTQWNCICDCGKEKIVPTKWLRNGQAVSCGCYNREKSTKHGMCQTRTYKIWAGMISRCTNPQNSRWKRYGGRGITVCNKWLEFESFYKDMGEAPVNCTLDRVNNDKGYSPENCRWTTPKVQSNNRENNRRITCNSETKTLSEWAEQTGLSKTVIANRLKNGWSVDDALSVPAAPREKPITWRGESKSLSQWARELGCSQPVLWNRIYKIGWDIERAFTEPIN